ncbi:ABC transporter ATP-binding protein [Borrelia sp. CA_690]|uniref:ABC transporter ATP-binding protein n=1 Tax=Borrelia maritima TaxID=2761123 RepID=A0A5J6WDF0_9SPIR|nr:MULTISPECIES: ABC transporter ATP-binding protein [Borrelia]QFI14775.1 ABC transporter ATP-binding protein [Borrelia maritima]WKC84634.1 ABC transporter ATP-binding protein [Borrelia sp. CA_690]
MKEDILVLENITKRYGDFVANDNVSIKFRPGEVHAILGENGAGKTTLMKTIYGIHQVNSGRIILKGQEVSFKDSSEAIQNGIGMVFQHFMLIPQFTAVQNIILGYENSKFGFLDYKQAKSKIKHLSEKYGLKIDLEKKVEDLSVGMEQKIEILKVLYRNADIIIFDEPTAVLAPSEVDEFMNILKVLTQEGHTVILITHKIKEIRSIAKQCTIMRLGKVVSTVNIAEIDDKDLTKLMIGKEIALRSSKIQFRGHFNVLEIRNLSVKDERGVLKVKDVDLNLKNGEILGISGIEGSGQEDLVDAILGLKSIFKGDILKKNSSGSLESLKGLTIKQIIDKKIGSIPSDRQRHGLILEFNVMQNIGLKSFDDPDYLKLKKIPSKVNFDLKKLNFFNFIKRQFDKVKRQFVGFDLKILKKLSNQLVNYFDIRPRGILNKVKYLSGGNQQKVIIAREVSLEPDILLAIQPTRGLDVGAVENIYKRIIEQRDAGRSVLLVSLELDELVNVCDRIAVMHDGRIVGILEDNFDIDLIGKMMIGLS